MTILLVFLILITLFFSCLCKNVEHFKHETYMTYVINLERSKDRLTKMSNSLKNANMNFTRIDAIDGKKLNKNIERKGEHGCRLSHIKTWKEFQKSSYEYAIIFEDDIIIPKEFLKILNHKLTYVPKDWDLIYLGGNFIYGDKINNHVLKPHIFSKEEVPGTVYNAGLFSYIINKKCVNKILKYIDPNKEPIDNQIRELHSVLNLYYLYPSVIQHDFNLLSERRYIDFNWVRYGKKAKKGNEITIVNSFV